MPRSVLLATASDLLALALEALVRACSGTPVIRRSRTLDKEDLAAGPCDVIVLDSALIPQLGAHSERRIKVRTIVLALSPGAGLNPQQTAEFACAMIRPVTPISCTRAILETVVPCAYASFSGAVCIRCPARRSVQPEPLPLSSREREIFGHIGSGRGPTEIARALGLSVKTVESYQASIKRKLGLRTRIELIDSAARWCRGELTVATESVPVIRRSVP